MSTEYLERSLGWRGRLAVRWHLAFCSACRAYYDQVTKTLRLLRLRPLDGPDAATEARLLAAQTGNTGEGA